MDFIERLFGISPDGGNGLTEAGLVIALIVLVTALLIRKYAGRPHP